MVFRSGRFNWTRYSNSTALLRRPGSMKAKSTDAPSIILIPVTWDVSRFPDPAVTVEAFACTSLLDLPERLPAISVRFYWSSAFTSFRARPDAQTFISCRSLTWRLGLGHIMRTKSLGASFTTLACIRGNCYLIVTNIAFGIYIEKGMDTFFDHPMDILSF